MAPGSDKNEIPEMNLNSDIDKKYQTNQKTPADMTQVQKETEKRKKELDKLKNFIIKKYSFTEAIGIIPPQAIKFLVDEEELGIRTQGMSKEDIEKISKKTHLQIIVPEEKFKEIPKIREEIVKYIDSIKQDVWLHIKTPVDIWELCMDGKFEISEAIGMSYPLHDKSGILSALRVAQIHKNLVLQKFDKYIVSYVIAGSLVRGDAVKTSDVDVFIVINDTDVKRMPRLELKERLRGMISQFIAEASALAGVKNNTLNVQTYLLTEFWESVKDANPVMFTFIRDGVPLYDRGTFMPWKVLLKMGKLKPSTESIEMFMSMGDKTIKRAKFALTDILVHDIYWGVVTPSQALLMLYGLPPPTPKQIVKEMEDIFVKKEKMIEKKYINILGKIVGMYKDFEHEKLKEVKGSEVEKLIGETEDYIKRLKELKEQIEKRAQEKTIEQIYNDVFNLLGKIIGKKSVEKTVEKFDKELVKKGKVPPQSLRYLNELINARKEFKKGKSTPHKIDQARKDSAILINDLVEYSQRKDLATFEKFKIGLKYKDGKTEKNAELVVSENETFLVKDGKIKMISPNVKDSDFQELTKAIESQKGKGNLKFNAKVFDKIRKELGDFEVVL